MNPLRWLWRALMEDHDTPPDPDQIVLLTTCEGDAMAGLWHGMLADKGIHSIVRDTSSTAYLRPGWVTLYELRVFFRDVDRERAILGLPADAS